MDVIARSANGFGYRADDHGNTLRTASSMTIDNRTGLHAKGVIEKTSDIDTFTFTTGGGPVSVHLDVATTDFGGAPLSVSNLNPTLKLFNSSGQLLGQAVGPVQLALNLQTMNLPAGTFFVQVGSAGEVGDVGQYFLTVNETAGARIVHSSFALISATQATMQVTFNEAIQAGSFTSIDVLVNGVAGAGVVSVVPTSTDGKSFLITMNKPVGTSQFKVAVGPNINDLFGNRMDQNQNGISAEATDAYFADFSRFLSTLSTTTTTTASKTTLSKSLLKV